MRRALHSKEYRGFLARLQRARREAGFHQAQVALALGRPQSYVSKCESGERRVDVVELTAFARLYGKPLDYFMPASEPGTNEVPERSRVRWRSQPRRRGQGGTPKG